MIGYLRTPGEEFFVLTLLASLAQLPPKADQPLAGDRAPRCHRRGWGFPPEADPVG